MTGPADRALIPVTVLTGFLGSGKTTVINHLLRRPELQGVVVIVNEFGAVGLDHLLIETSEERFALLENGCICCSVRDDLIVTLGHLQRRRRAGALPEFTRVLVETTGLADPVPILHTLMTSLDLAGHYRVDGVAVTVDAVNGARTLQRQDEAIKQIAVADRIMLTKCDLVDAATVAALRRMIAAINPTATLQPIENGSVEPASILDAGMFDPSARTQDVAAWFDAASSTGHHHGIGYAPHENCGPDCDHKDHHHHAHDPGISSFSLTINEPVQWAAFSRWLDYVATLKGEDLLRFKGLVQIAERPDNPVVVHGVQHIFHPPIELKSWPSADRATRLVFIVRNIPRDVIENTLVRFAAIRRGAIERPAA
ncbi:GTP-binding protein [Bradyrhizobium sp. KB893862 SZCCT0404]|uniref:CobW family GTP-binding protein n=1 Tax=Bradyrhizobium sp. KB893862 SZCCT0404 TaxID=2807672 RepID=UPI001BA4A78D|nr:GTP-binding protein [Bradyrhizobium sp. KB893862 SZCCT0404]MBR1177205.1 GTP-binding protein [Bradyrhizobium sp. KB893862 SZCCT0404]